MTTIYDALKKDHDTLRPLLDRLVASKSGSEERKRLITMIKDELVPHSRAEEAVFYNSLRLTDAGREVSREGFKEHAEAEAILHALNGMETLKMDGDKLARKLKDALEHHIAEEEGEFFVKARQLLLEKEAEMMGDAFLRLKEEISQQGDAKNMLELVVNMMPERFRPGMHSI